MAVNVSFHGPNAGYAIELYERYRRDPESVDPGTRAHFDRWGPPPELAAHQPTLPAAGGIMKAVGAARLAWVLRERGHMAAHLDPLGTPPPGEPALALATHGLTEQDLATLPASVVGGAISEHAVNALHALQQLRDIYCGPIGYDFDQIHDAAERDWLQDAVESGRHALADEAETERAMLLLLQLTEVETFERFLHQTFPGQKWFSIEGLDMLVPMLDEIIYAAAASGTREVVIGLAHRGRLNVLAHVVGQPYEAIIARFMHGAEHSQGTPASDRSDDGWTGDVKYHLGATHRLLGGGQTSMPITLAPNPSHLEHVNPVVEGRARAAQERRDAPGRPVQDERASLAILIHGDAAFPGQGMVAETLNLSRLAGYHTGGTIHIIANNQVGFTAGPREARSTLYAADLAKGFEIPTVHVNADIPHACLLASRLAHAYRERFQKDFVIDLIGYRRYGHNEVDEPGFTQPVMYERIREHPSVRQILAEQLHERGVVAAEQAQAMIERVQERLQQAQEHATRVEPTESEVVLPAHQAPEELERLVPAPALLALNQALLVIPRNFTPNPKLERVFQGRREALRSGRIDWAQAETLAFASILADGTPIRLTGQDVARGTFSQRHLTLHDVRTGTRHTPLQALPQAAAAFAVHNSPLSENAALGFEYGYSTHAPETLVVWEAQFGDFANGAQVIIDQFISAGQAKWRQRSGIVVLLPHGYEGQGPEHSSARLERFLQLAAGDNIRVANVTTAAQYYHLLRRQAALLGTAPRPLIVMAPKSLLRHPAATSRLEDLSDLRFQPVLNDPAAMERADQVRRVILCSGKVFADLITSKEYERGERPAVIRVEELYPFPARRLQELLAGYPTVQEVIWVQEEPRNMGAWGFVAHRLRELLDPEVALGYIGRPERASPAEGSVDLHNVQQTRIVRAALAGRPDLVVCR